MKIKDLFCFKKIIIFSVLLVFIFGFSDSVWAIELPNINKSKIRLSIVPGQSNYGEIIVENSTSEPRSMRIYLGDWYYLPAADGTKEFVAVGTTPLSCAPWISFSPSELNLAAFSRQKVNYSVKVPPEASGGYYAALFFESLFGKQEIRGEEMTAAMNIAVRIATLFYVEAEGTIKRSASLNNLSAEKIQADTWSIQLDFLNTGNVDITAGGTCHIMDKTGMVFARGQFNNVYTFPDGSSKLSAECKGKIPKGIYDLILTIDLGKALQEVGIGRGPVITKETEIEIGDYGEVLNLGQLL